MRKKLMIDYYIDEMNRQRKLTFWQKLGTVLYTMGGMMTDQIKPNGQRPGILGHAPMPYSAVFFILFLVFLGVLVWFQTLIT
jgi:hypothetical protein